MLDRYHDRYANTGDLAPERPPMTDAHLLRRRWRRVPDPSTPRSAR
jgi:hypothetical protein